MDLLVVGLEAVKVALVVRVAEMNSLGMIQYRLEQLGRSVALAGDDAVLLQRVAVRHGEQHAKAADQREDGRLVARLLRLLRQGERRYR